MRVALIIILPPLIIGVLKIETNSGITVCCHGLITYSCKLVILIFFFILFIEGLIGLTYEELIY